MGGGEDDFYKLIYGNNQEAGTKNYKLGLIAYDGARKVPAEENDRGNATSVFYMNNDFAEISGFKTSIAYNILNGTAKVASGNPYETWEKALEDKKIEQATFSLNPVNNPYFDIQNYEPLGTQNPDGSNSIDLDVETYSFMNKNKLTVNLYVGRDKKAIKTETIGIYLLPCDRYGNLLENETKVTLLEPYKDKNGNIIGVDNTSQITTVGSTSYRWSSESINVKDIDGLNIGKYYIFDVVAYDYNGVGIRNDNKYGIKMTSTSAAPIIQITEPGVTKSVASSKPYVVKGLVKTSAEITGIKVFKNIQDNLIEGLDFQTMEEGKTNAEALAITEGIVLNTEESTDVLKIYNYAFTVPSIEDESYTVIIYASDTNGQSASKEITVSNDKEAPKFDSVASITPYVDVEEGDGGNKKIVQKVNGLVNIKQLISDNVKVEKVWYSTNEVYPTEENHWTEYTDEIKTTFTLNIDTKDFDNDEGVGERIIYLKAQDTAGNVTENGKTGADALIKLMIDQKTDAPRISLSNVTTDGEEWEKVQCPENGFTVDGLKVAKQNASVFGTTSNNYILGTVEDDDGIAKVSVLCCTGSKWDENSKETLLEEEVKGKTTYNIKAKLPETEGAHLIKIVVEDSKRETTYATTTINPFLIGIDNGAPNLEVKTESGVFYSGTVTVTGIMDDAAAELYRSDKAEKITVGEGGIWEDTINISPDQTTFDYTYTATDEYNQSTTRNFSFKYDPTAPRFDITEIQGSSDDKFELNKDYSGYIADENPTAKVLKYGNLTDYFTVKGTVKDDWQEGSSDANTSGIGSYFYYCVGELSNASDTYNPVGDDRKTPINGWKSCTVTKRDGEDPSWEAPISFKDFANGDSVNIYFAAVDNAGNVSIIKDNPSAVLKVVIDQNPPTVKTPSFEENSKIKVLALDKESNIDEKSIIITRNGESIELTDSKVVFGKETITEVEGENQTSKEYKSITLKISKEDLVEGKNKFIISIKDLAGNTAKTSEIVIDNNAPTFPSDKRNTGIPKTAYVKDSCSYVKEFFETTATINCEGTNNKLGKVYYSDMDSEGNVIVENEELEVDIDNNILISKSTDKAKYEGKIVTRTVIAENIYGIKSEPWTFTFNADFTLPKITSTKVESKVENYDGWFNKTTLSISGTSSDENSGINYVTYKLGEKEGEIYPSGDNKEAFAANIGGFAEGSNTLDLSVTDNAGNTSNAISKVLKIDTTLPKLLETVAPDAAEDSDVSAIWYRFKDESGESKWEKFEGSILTNVTKDIELTGAFEDKNDDILQSGVKNITIKVNSNDVAATVYEKVDETWTEKSFDVAEEDPNKEGRWYAVISAANLENVATDCTATVSIVDNAGNEGITKDVIFQIDTEAPTVTVEMPSTGSVLNGNNIFSGKVVDKNNVQSIELFYFMSDSETAPTNFAEFTSLGKKVVGEDGVALSDVTSWKFEKNVNELLAESKDKQEMFILPVAYDKAGNNNISGTNKLDEDVSINGKLTQVTVDKHSDRPIIKFTNLSSSGTTAYINATTLNASVEDDDGISEVKVEISETEPDWSTVPKLAISSGGFKVDLGLEGKKTIWFYIKDSAGGEFTTKADAGNLKQPYLLFDGSEEKQDNSEELDIIKDTQVPTIDTENLAFGFASTEAAATTNVKNSEVEVDKKAKLGTKNLAGGTKRQFIAFEVPASDGGSGVDSVKVVVTSEDKTEKEYSCELSSGKYYSEAIDVKEEDLSGIQTVTFRVKDKSGLESTSTKQIIIDNTAPTLEVISPLPADEVTGVVTLTGTTNDDDSNIAIVKYLVLNDKYVTDFSDQTPDVEPKEFGDCENKGSSLRSWKFELNNLPSSDAELNAEENGYTNITHTEQNIYTLPIYFYVEDELGNGKVIKDKTITYNPFGDRPKAEVTYPTGTSEDKANVNGAIRVTGSASDNVSVKEVYIQLDVNNDGNFNNDDITILDACLDAGTTGNKVYTIVKSATEYRTIVEDAEDEDVDVDMSAISDNFWGIKVNGTNSWNYTINKFSELLTEGNKVAGAEGKYAVNIIAVAVDNNYKFGNWSDIQYVEFDTNIPTIGTHNKNVLEYDAEESVKATKAYIPDMYLKGKVDLELSVEDKEGIKQVMYYVADTEEGLASATGTIINNLGEAKTWGFGESETKGYIVKIPLAEDSRASGTKYVKVVATKDSDTETTAYEKFSVNFDNSAPDLQSISLNGVDHAESDKKIVNSNGTYFTLGGTVEDDGGSGFDKLVFYYYREKSDGTNGRIYNPMIDSVSDDNKNKGRIDINPDKSMTIAGKSIYGSKQTVTIGSDKKTITLATQSDHIRAGGLVNIDGNWITIESVTGTTVTLKTDSSVTGSVEAFFAYAQVIDNTGSEKTDASGNLTSGDDGDQMAESIIKSLNTWTCDATFHSNYIPDGPGKFVVFAFDKAGNVVSGEYDASVQNNAPRLTRIMLATDLNGNKSYEYDNSNGNPVNDLSDDATANGTEFGEFAFYSTLNNMGEPSNIATVSLPAGRDPFIVKNNLLVVPEFVGGNGEISYTYNIGTAETNNPITGDVTQFATTSKIIGTLSNSDIDGVFSKEFEILNGEEDDENSLVSKESWIGEEKSTKYLSATFWDSTEETTPGTDSCYALLNMPIIINVKDDKKPTAHIIPFYWNSKEDSSFVYDDDGNPLGHIDIEAEPSVSTRPGVSGEVYIEGEAWDDTRLGSIWITDPDGKQKQVASYEDGNWSKVTTNWPTNWNDFEILEDSGISQRGHTVKWRFHINMTPYGIEKEQKVYVEARDAMKEPKPNVSDNVVGDDDNSVQTVENALTPTYIMDFVPYIKSIYATDVGSATRSRLGKFPVRAGELMTIEGMNFAKGASYEVKFYKSNAAGSGPAASSTTDGLVEDKAYSGTITADGKIEVYAPLYSRWVEVVVTPEGGTAVPTSNNSNQNGGYNIEAGYVAKANDKGLSQANTAGTNFWTDDRYISVWNVGEGVEGSSKPMAGMIKQINNDIIYRRVSDSDFCSSQPVNSNNILATWSSTDEIQLYGKVIGDNYTTSGRTIGTTEATFYEAPPVLDVCIINGVPFYVALDNYVGGNSANAWGAGLFFAREGWKFSKGSWGITTQNQNFIERQGAQNKEDSSNGYDGKKNQFINPHITGCVDDSGKTNIWISYYDSYARCLKYAAYKETVTMSENTSVTQNFYENFAINFEVVMSTFSDMDSGDAVVAGYDTLIKNENKFELEAGEYNDILMDDQTPVLIYYNKTSGALEIARPKVARPTTGNIHSTNGFSPDGTDGANGWYKTKGIKPEGISDFGRYVSATIDSAKNLHIAAQDVNKGTLYYGKFSKDSDGETYSRNGDWQIVDATSSVGMWTDIELDFNNNPVISYIDTSKLKTISAVKVAYKEGDKWESITNPAKLEAIDDKTSVVANAYETTSSTTAAKVAVGFNSTMFAVDFLRGE